MSRSKLGGLLLALLLIGWFASSSFAQGTPTASDDGWLTRTASGKPRVHLYFFWTRTCPHCRRARPFIESLPTQYSWLELHSHDLSQDMAAGLRYARMAEALGESARAVPALLFCGRMLTGFDSPDSTGRALRQQLEECHHRYAQSTTASAPMTITPSAVEPPVLTLPLLGALDLSALSLPALTVVLAGLDAFNPCAFFVLLFLLSLLVHARDRRRMLLIGGVFVFFSGAIYFMFMTAWLNVFLWLGELRFITVLAGLLAVSMGGVNVKDFFAFRQGPSLSIADEAKPKLFKRMQALVGGEKLLSLLTGTIALAIVANSYELLCTAGFPMVYTRALTLNQLSTGAYYGYLALYNLIYILPLLAIVLVFTWTLGSRKLREGEARVLKLLSGIMMMGLGLLLLVYPEGLSDALTSLLVIAAALALTGVAAVVKKG